MPTHYLQVEAINTEHVLSDCQDLSTVRGGSFLIRDLPIQLPALLSAALGVTVTLTTISCGASVGVFSFDSDIASPQQVIGEVRRILSGNPFQHATFAVVSMSDFDAEALTAKVRWQQLSSPSLAYPHEEGTQVCSVDLVRPAARAVRQDGGQTLGSPSVQVRQRIGREKKTSFYAHETGLTYEFVHDFGKLAGDAFSQGKLNNKMCVIYLDGNGFTRIQRQLAPGAEGLRDWDRRMEIQRRSFLSALLPAIATDPAWLNAGEIRLETLLWGGDEFLVVVPAWQGWFLLEFFYRHAAAWDYQSQALTFAAGIVFCNHKAPIHRIVSLARGLADRVKKEDRTNSSFAYQVLESFDHIHQDIDEMWQKRSTASALNPLDFILRPDDLARLRQDIARLRKDEFPRRKLHTLLQGLIARQPDPEIEKQLDALWLAQLGQGANPRSRWVHLHELWDYAV